MQSSFRRFSKSRLGTIVLALFVVAIFASFALGDLANVRSGNFSLSSGSLASVGGSELTEREVNGTIDRQLTRIREENPEAQMADLLPQFDEIIATLLQRTALGAWADSIGFRLSKRLVDAEIARIPATKGLDGRVTPQSYQAFLQQQRLTDAELRTELRADLLQQILLSPVGGNSRVGVGFATPYAAMLLEARQGDVALVPSEAFRAGPAPTDSELTGFYRQNGARYTVPEQRVLRIARIGNDQVASIAATEQEIAAAYTANQAIYGGKAIRVISQTVSQDKAAADAIAGRTRGGASFAAAAAPAGFSAADISVGPQTRQQFETLAGGRVAAAAFAAASGAIVGPVQSDLGWHVLRIDEIRNEAGRPLAAVRGEISTRLTADKRKNALTDLVTRVEDAIADGSSFAEVTAANRLPVTETPPLTAGGVARSQPAFKLPAELAPLLKAGFEIAADDDPVIETLPGDAGYALLGVGNVIAAAPAPLASIRDQVRDDFIARRASDRARAVATAIVAKAARGVPLARAVAEAKVAMPAARPIAARRIDLSQMGGQVPPPLTMLFALGTGKARLVAAPEGQGYFIVKLNRIIPGNALNQPQLIAQTQGEFGQLVGQEYAEQFLRAVQTELGVKRDEAAIARLKRQLGGQAN